MNFTRTESDTQVLRDLGERIQRHRLDRNLTQAELAAAAGVSKRTVERLEAGDSTQLTNFIRILRALGRLEGLDALLPPPLPSPVDLLKLQGRQRQRASASRASESKEQTWTWKDGQ